VVITGLGAITPLAVGVADSWHRLCDGTSGIGPITRFDASEMPTRIAGEVKGFDAHLFMDRKVLRRSDLFTQYAIAASRMAIDDAGLNITEETSLRTGVILGSAVGGIGTLCHNVNSPADGVSKMLASMYIPSAGANDISVVFGLKGPSRGLSTACATGGHCIGDCRPLHSVRRGRHHGGRRLRGADRCPYSSRAGQAQGIIRQKQ
jgi:3-oxoacyl-[acyl-carrier-protein] synthase II